MAAIGAHLARARPQPEDAALRLYLSGPLGAGKTTLARGFILACGAPGPVRSPSFALVESHAAPALTLLHVDLYRLASPDALELLGLRETDRPDTVWIVEWPERATGWLPAPDLHLALSIGEDAHRCELAAATPAGRAWFEAATYQHSRLSP